jgi:hypothetical protein
MAFAWTSVGWRNLKSARDRSSRGSRRWEREVNVVGERRSDMAAGRWEEGQGGARRNSRSKDEISRLIRYRFSLRRGELGCLSKGGRVAKCDCISMLRAMNTEDLSQIPLACSAYPASSCTSEPRRKRWPLLCPPPQDPSPPQTILLQLRSLCLLPLLWLSSLCRRGLSLPISGRRSVLHALTL